MEILHSKLGLDWGHQMVRLHTLAGMSMMSHLSQEQMQEPALQIGQAIHLAL